MRHGPLIAVASMLVGAALVWADAAPQEWVLARNVSLVNALVCLELGLAPLVLLFKPGRGAATLASNFSAFAACWACASAVVLLFSFATPLSVGLQTRSLSLCAWLAASGVLAFAASVGRHGQSVARPLLLAAFALPPLFHYLSLEYSGRSQEGMAVLSPHWLLAMGQAGHNWGLAAAGVAGWAAAAAVSLWKRGPK